MRVNIPHIVNLLIILFISNESSCQDSRYICSNIPSGTDDCAPMKNTLTSFKAQLKINDSVINGMNATYHRIYIWVTVPFNDSLYMFSKNHVEPAVYRALEDANATLCDDVTDITIASGQRACYSVFVNDSNCNADYALTQVVEIQDSRIIAEQCGVQQNYDNLHDMDVIVGLSCDFATGRVGTLATHWNWPTFFPGARVTSLDNKDLPCCGTLTRAGHTATDFGNFILQLYTRYGWDRSTLVYSSDRNHGAPVHNTTLSDCATLMAGITNVIRPSPFTYHINPVNWDKELLDDDTVKETLRTIGSKTRVSFWCIGRKAMRHVMNVASEMDMTSGTDDNERFAFFYLDFYNTNTSYQWTDIDDLPCTDPDYCDADIGDSRIGMEALQIISLYQPQTDEYEKFSDDMKTVMGPVMGGYDQFVNPFVAQYYNSIRLLVNGVTSGLEGNSTNLLEGGTFARRLWNTSFYSVDGRVTIDENGDRLMDYSVMDMDPTSELFETAEVYFGYNSTWVVKKPIYWPGQSIPPNKPPCGSYVCPTLPTLEIVLISCACVLLICLLATLYIARHKVTRERNMRKMMWKVKPEDVIFPDRDGAASSVQGSMGSGGSEMLVSGALNRQIFTKTAEWKKHLVAVKYVERKKKITVDRKLQLEMEQMMSLNHEHICKFYGASVEEPVMVLTEYCQRGSLQDFLEGDMYEKLDDVFRNSLISDIADGMHFLHKTSIRSHGNLKSSNCLLNSRLVLKLTDFGLSSFRARKRKDSVIEYNHHKDILWTSPELLRLDDPPVKGTQKGDIYSFAIVVQEVLFRMGVFYLGEREKVLTPTEIIKRVRSPPPSGNPFRPTLEDNDDVVIEQKLRHLVNECWDENPEVRPSFQHIVASMKKLTNFRRQNLIDRMLSRLEQYSNTLEEKVDIRTQQYKAEKERADLLLYQMLPQTVADRLKRGQEVLPENFESVTIYFSDIVGFTAISHDSTPFEVVTMLDSLYTTFDNVVDRFDVYKVETIGDAYMVVSGLPERNGKLHVREVARMALNLIEEVKRFKIPHMPDRGLQLRVGIHSGSVVAGVVGQKMPRYCLFGDTVNTAARMEQNGKALKIHLSPPTKSLLAEFKTFVLEQRGDEVNLKGLGKWKTWWLEGEIGQNYEPSAATETTNLTTDQPQDKKISNTSDYGSARSSIQDGISHPVTGAECIEVDEIHSAIPNMVTFESECERPTRYPVLGTENSTSEKEKRRKRIAQLQNANENANNVPEKKKTGKSSSQRRVQFHEEDDNPREIFSPEGSKSSSDSGLAFPNGAYASEEFLTKM